MNSSNETCVDIYKQAETNGDLTTYFSVQFIFGCVYTIIFIGGLLGNSFVVIAVVKSKRLKNIHSSLIGGLALSDVVFCLICLPITPYSLVVKTWEMGEILCKGIPYIQAVSVLVSAFSLCVISIHRYFMVVHMKSDGDVSGTTLLTINGFIWMTAGIIGSPFLFVMTYKPAGDYCGRFCGEDFNSTTGKDFQYGYGIALASLQYLLPFVIIAFCSSQIVVKLNKQAKFRLGSLNVFTERNNERKVRHEIRRNRRTNRIILLLTLAVGLSWLPQTLLFMTLDLFDNDVIPQSIIEQVHFITMISHCIASSAILWNPILYAGMNRHFKDFFRQWILDSGMILNNWFRQEGMMVEAHSSKLLKDKYQSDMTPDISQKATMKATSPSDQSVSLEHYPMLIDATSGVRVCKFSISQGPLRKKSKRMSVPNIEHRFIEDKDIDGDEHL